AFERATNLVRARHRGEWVRPDDPDGFDAAVFQRFEHAHRIKPGFRRNAPHRHAPDARDFLAVARIGDVPIAGQLATKIADLASTHGIGLPSERERSAAWPSNFSRGQVKVDEREVLGGAAGALIDAHRPKAERLSRLTEPEGGAVNIQFPYAALPCR